MVCRPAVRCSEWWKKTPSPSSLLAWHGTSKVKTRMHHRRQRRMMTFVDLTPLGWRTESSYSFARQNAYAAAVFLRDIVNGGYGTTHRVTLPTISPFFPHIVKYINKPHLHIIGGQQKFLLQLVTIQEFHYFCSRVTKQTASLNCAGNAWKWRDGTMRAKEL